MLKWWSQRRMRRAFRGRNTEPKGRRWMIGLSIALGLIFMLWLRDASLSPTRLPHGPQTHALPLQERI